MDGRLLLAEVSTQWRSSRFNLAGLQPRLQLQGFLHNSQQRSLRKAHKDQGIPSLGSSWYCQLRSNTHSNGGTSGKPRAISDAVSLSKNHSYIMLQTEDTSSSSSQEEVDYGEVGTPNGSEDSLIKSEQRWAHAQMAFNVDGGGDTPESAAELRLQNSSLRAELKSTRSKLEHLHRQHEVCPGLGPAYGSSLSLHSRPLLCRRVHHPRGEGIL